MADLEESDRSRSEDEEDEEDEEDSDEEEHETPVPDARKDAVYNAVGLHEKLEEMAWPTDADWPHSLAVSYSNGGAVINVDDDLTREMSFYTQALEGAREAYQKLQALGMPFRRPTDYYAEMVKTDSHMLKIKDKLLHEKTSLEEMDERRKAREVKKFAKEVQAEKLKERSKRKKDDIEAVKKWRKVRQNSGFTEGADDNPFGDSGGAAANSKKGQVRKDFGPNRGGPLAKKRQFKDAKYGNGGRKDKRNNAESSADDSGYRGSFKDGEDRGLGRGRGSGRGRGRVDPSVGRSSSRGKEGGGSFRGGGGRRGKEGGGSFRGRSSSRGREGGGSFRGRGGRRGK